MNTIIVLILCVVSFIAGAIAMALGYEYHD